MANKKGECFQISKVQTSQLKYGRFLFMEWNFPSNNHGEVKGISDSGVETFQGTPLKSLAWEICQNSLDAAI